MKKLFISIFVVYSSIHLVSANLDNLNEYDAAQILANEGIIENNSDNTYDYRVNDKISREELSKIIVKMAKVQIYDWKSVFEDTNFSSWWEKYAKTLNVYGYATSNKLFRPRSNTSKIESLKWVMMSNQLYPPLKYASIEDWRLKYVSNAIDKGISFTFSDYDTEVSRWQVFIWSANALQLKNNSEQISTYYNLISQHKLDEAYAMKYNPSTSLEAFKNTYASFNGGTPPNWWEYFPESISVFNYKKISLDTYAFQVDIDDNGNISRYNTQMKVSENNKLQTLSVKEISSEIIEEISNDDKKAYIEWAKWTYSVYFEEQGQKYLVTFKQYNPYYHIWGLEFISDGNILTFKESGFEYGWTLFYNILSKKFLSTSYISTYWFTEDNKYLYVCGESGFAWGEINIYNYDDLSLYKNLGEERAIGNCYGDKLYNSDKNTITYQIGFLGASDDVYLETYNFDTDTTTKQTIE